MDSKDLAELRLRNQVHKPIWRWRTLISLDGEAYFEVAKDSLNRFVVQAGDLAVERWALLLM